MADEERKAKLAALRQKRKRQEGDEDVDENESNNAKHIKFRNYNPHDNELKEDGTETEQRSTKKDDKNVTEIIEESVSELITNAVQETEAVNLAPKKPNWDLKRDVDTRLLKLNRLTQLAIIQMNKEKENDEEDEEEN